MIQLPEGQLPLLLERRGQVLDGLKGKYSTWPGASASISIQAMVISATASSAPTS